MRRFIILFCLKALLSASINESISIGVIRVSFLDDNLNSTTGSGTFLMESQGIDCGNYTIDPPPHDRDYFFSQLNAVSAYYEKISYGNFSINLNNSEIFPISNLEDYKLSQYMNYYNPYDDITQQEKRITELFRDALEQAYLQDQINFSDYDLIIVFHAGIGQDFSLPFLDPTPEDIPSTYIDNDMILKHLNMPSILLGESAINKGVVLPETQNHLLYDISETMFSDALNPCEYQYGLTGTFALMIGFAIGLPPLWNINTGESGVGVFGLMDQGSNNGRGIIPAPPTAWTRIYAGWEAPTISDYGNQYSLSKRSKNSIVKVPIRDNEYYLIESRLNWVRSDVSIDSIRFYMGVNSTTNTYPPYFQILQDSTGIVKDSNNVVVSVPNYDIGLPESGLLIWHIDEDIINYGIEAYSINSEISNRGVDLEESDGAQDIGYISLDIFNDPSSGWFGDMWYKGNSQYIFANPGMVGVKPSFGPYTYPSTRANDGSSTYINISEISKAKDTMTFIISNSYMINNYPDSTFYYRASFDINNDGINDFIGGSDSLYIIINDSITNRQYFHNLDSENVSLGFSIYDDRTTIEIFEYYLDSLHHFQYDYILATDSILGSSDNWSDTLFYTISNENHTSIEFISEAQWDSHVIRVLSSPSNFSIGLNNNGIIADYFGGSINKYQTKTFNYIAGIDLDLDAQGDLLALDDDGVLYGFNHQLSLMTSFPLDIKLSEPILSQNILGNDFPEIIAKSLDKTILYVLDHQGNVILEFATNVNDDLIAIDRYQEKHCIFTKSSIYQFEPYKDPNGNKWSTDHGSLSNARRLNLNYSFSPNNESLLSKAYCYPNPIVDDLGIVRVEAVGASNIKVIIYDVAGYFIESFKTKMIPGGNQIKEWNWDTTELDPGIYFANISVSNTAVINNKTIKIVVVH
ncbi:MAG: hypothetical protein CMG55_09535 [Candidatus Marinimicrobia bacterium]|nr:hypothetical protein [Candidatus Neomarinimicrobiota bacterium]